jgi:hypothetical protein
VVEFVVMTVILDLPSWTVITIGWHSRVAGARLVMWSFWYAMDLYVEIKFTEQGD